MPSKRRPDSNQLAALLVAKAAGIEPAAAVREFESFVKKVPKKSAKKKRK